MWRPGPAAGRANRLRPAAQVRAPSAHFRRGRASGPPPRPSGRPTLITLVCARRAPKCNCHVGRARPYCAPAALELPAGARFREENLHLEKNFRPAARRARAPSSWRRAPKKTNTRPRRRFKSRAPPTPTQSLGGQTSSSSSSSSRSKARARPD